MAYNYQSFATLGVNLNRQNYGSLDISQVFNSQADLNYYMSKGAIKDGVSKYWLDTVPYPYAGQYLALVVDGKVSAYILSEKTDGTFEALEVGKVPVGDDKSIEVSADGTVSIKGFNEITAAQDDFLPRVKWIAEVPAQGEEGQEGYVPAVPAHAEIEWVPVAEVVKGDGDTITKVTSTDGSVSVSETKDTETNIITYDLSVDVPEYRIQKDGRVEGSKEQTYHLTKDGEVLGVAITVPDAYDGTEIEGRVSDLEDKVSKKADQADVDNALLLKANAADVYTKADTDKKIGEAVAAVDHLKRVILDAPTGSETEEDVINAWLITNNLTNVADQYIYMIPSGLEISDNKYYEYIIIINGENRSIEKVGNWEVDLGDYLTSAAAAETYAKKNDVAETLKGYVTNSTLENYVTDNELSTTLNDYALKSEIPTDYVSDEEIKAYDTATVADGKYAPKEATTKALDERYTKEEVNDLISNYYTEDEVNNLLKDKVAVEDGKSLIANTEIERLAKVNENAEENFINSVDEEIFTVTEEKLNLKAVPQKIVGGLTKTSWTVETIIGENGEEVNNFVATTSPAFLEDILKPATYDAETQTGTSGLMTAEQVQKLQALVIGEEGVEISGTVNADNVTGLGAWITTNRDKVEGLYPVTAKNLLDELNDAINNETTGLIADLTAVKKRVLDNENAISGHAERLESLEYAMSWHDMTIN